MFVRFNSSSTSFYAIKFYRCIVNKRIEDAHCITPAAYRSNNMIRQLSNLILQLLFCLSSNDRLKVSYNCWEWMGTNNRTENIMGVFYIGNQIGRASCRERGKVPEVGQCGREKERG